MTTYAQYQAGDYDSAEQSAEHYVKLYPKSQEAAYALYLEASSYYRQIPDISRDQERAGKALVAVPAGGEGISRTPNMSRTRSTRSR